MLVGENIRKRFGKTEVLHGVNVVVEKGKITALIGPSGSGKTTLLRSLSLLDPPSEGKVSINGRSYSFPLEDGLRVNPPWPDVTVVFQQLFLWPHLTLRQNITLPIRKRKKSNSEKHLDELIALMDMGEFIDRYPNEASLGQRQRAAIARALILDPSYMLLDEITSALDVEQVSGLLKHLHTLRDRGIGILIVTHLIGFARRAADRIVFLDDGEVLEQGGREVIDSPTNERVRRFLSVIESAT